MGAEHPRTNEQRVQMASLTPELGPKGMNRKEDSGITHVRGRAACSPSPHGRRRQPLALIIVKKPRVRRAATCSKVPQQPAAAETWTQPRCPVFLFWSPAHPVTLREPRQPSFPRGETGSQRAGRGGAHSGAGRGVLLPQGCPRTTQQLRIPDGQCLCPQLPVLRGQLRT